MGQGLGGLETVRSGMLANEKALQTSSNNLSNINTKGYARQQVMMKSGNYEDILGGRFQSGLGTMVQETRQVRNDFLDGLYRDELQSLGYWQKREKTFEDLEGVIGEPIWDGLQNSTNQFLDSWQELSKGPNSLATRALVAQRGQALATHVNDIENELRKLQDDMDLDLYNYVSDINSMSKKIAQLNLDISQAEVTGDRANDYRDKRNLLVDKLSKYGNCNTYENMQGEIDVYLGGAQLVSQLESYNLVVGKSENSGTFHCIKLEGSDAVINVSNGQIKGLLEARGEVAGSDDSISNGYPDERADISIVIDVSDSSSSYLDKIKNSVSTYVSELDKRGIDTNFRLITYWGDNNVASTNFEGDKLAFVNAVRNLTTNAAATTNKFETVAGSIANPLEYREDVNKYAVVFSAESPSGDENIADFSAINNTLINAGIKTIIVAPNIYADSGLPVGEVKGWADIAQNTGGTIFDIESDDFSGELTKVSDFINSDVNKQITNISIGTDIIPFVLKTLNAFTNIIVREVNYIHSQGRTLGENSQSAQDFFVSINSAYNLKAGNIMLNPNLYDTDNISASGIDGQSDNSIALRIANIKTSKLFSDSRGDVAVDEYYQRFILELSTINAESVRVSENQNKIVETTDASRQAVMGVSLDEEMSDVLKYKFAYNACSRAFNVIDQLMDQMINRMGLVGR